MIQIDNICKEMKKVNFRQNYEQETYPNDRYNRIRMVIDFLTSLNDSDAISLYQELKGLKI